MTGRLEKLRELLLRELDRGKGRRQLCREIGIPTASLYNYLYSDTQPSVESLIKLAHYFRMPPSYFIDGAISKMIPEYKKPIERISSGGIKDIPVVDQEIYLKWKDFTDLDYPANNSETFVPFCPDDPNAFFVMPTKGTLFLVEPHKDIADGNIVLVCLGKDITIRRINKKKNTIVLCPIDGSLQPTILDADEAKKMLFYRITKEITDL